MLINDPRFSPAGVLAPKSKADLAFIMVLKKSKSENSTLFIDASREFIKVTNNNKLTQENIEKIITAYARREAVQHFTKSVPNSDIAE